MEIDEALLTQDFFPTSFKRQDVTTLPSYKKWIKAKKDQGKKVVKCPWCWGYEVFEEPTNHRCPMCNSLYCQKCLQKCVEDEVIHDHEQTCCDKFCRLIEIMHGYGPNHEISRDEICEIISVVLIFIFGNHVLYTIKYFKFFNENNVIDNNCVHTFFKYMNLFTNILYCIVFTILYIEFFFTLFFPAIFIKCYFKIIVYNWQIVLDFGVDESPITEITVRGRGYDY